MHKFLSTLILTVLVGSNWLLAQNKLPQRGEPKGPIDAAAIQRIIDKRLAENKQMEASLTPEVLQKLGIKPDAKGMERRLKGSDAVLTGYHPVFGPRFTATTSNVNSAITVSTNKVQPGGSLNLNLTGAGTTIFEWDGGNVRQTHQEFGNRVTNIDNSGFSNHATHVAGTMIAAGVNAPARGMANQANITAYDFFNDMVEISTAATGGARISNHSYGNLTGWHFNQNDGNWYWYGDTRVSTTTDYRFGYYDDGASDLDVISYNNPRYLMVWAAGNDRGQSGPGAGGSHFVWNFNTGQWENSNAVRNPDGQYDCLPASQTAKNILTIGAVNMVADGAQSTPSNIVMSSFSSWGPTDDGRIKPDLVASGVNLLSSGSGSNNDYNTLSGTSMAAPTVTGSLALMQQLYNTRTGQQIRAATLKALAINTAYEAGTTPGPDYAHGHGLLNTAGIAEAITGNGNGVYQIIESNISQGQTREYTLNVGSATAIPKVTLVWHDFPGTVNTNLGTILNNRSPKLVTDLDLRLISPSNVVHQPWRLSFSNPSAAATRGDNAIDNVEQILASSGEVGQWRIVVSHKGTLGGPHEFSIASWVQGGSACPDKPVITPNGPTAFCPGAAVTLQGPAGFQYLWSTGQTSQNINVNVSGSYTLRTIANGCTSEVSDPIVVNANLSLGTPTITINPSTNFCSNVTAQLNASIISAGQSNLVGTIDVSSNQGNNPSAFPGFWSKTRQQFIYTRQELINAGLRAGPISALTFNILTLSEAQPASIAGFAIRIGHTTQTNFSTTSFISTGLQSAFVGTISRPSSLGNYTWNLTTPFNWNGIDNIVIESCHNFAGLGTDNGNALVGCTNYVGGALFTGNDNNDVCATATGIILNIKPVLWVSGNVVNNFANYTWTGSGAQYLNSTTIANPTFSGPAAGGNFNLQVVATSLNCTSTPAFINITADPSPTTPVALVPSSSHCGTQLADVEVAGEASTLRWYDAAVGGNLLQIGGNKFNTPVGITTIFYVERVSASGGCSSSRIPLSVTVSPGPQQPVIVTDVTSPYCAPRNVQISVLGVGPGSSEKVGSGFDLSSTTSGPTTFPGYWSKVRQQWIYTRAELEAAGVLAGPITSITSTVLGTGALNNPATLAGFTVRIAHTGQTAYSNALFINNGFQTVMGPLNLPKPTSIGSHTLFFTTPFVWNGIDNIVIETCHNYAGAGPTGGNAQVQTTFIANSCLYSGNDGTDVCNNPSGAINSFRPNLVFGATVTSDPGATYSWSGTGVNFLSSTTIPNPVFATPVAGGTFNLNLTVTKNGCSLDPVPLTLVADQTPTTPTAVVAASTHCGEQIPTVQVAGEGSTLRWYNAPTGGVLLQTGGNTFQSPISASTVLYVERVSANGACASPTRLALTVTVNPGPPKPIITPSTVDPICAGATVNLNVSAQGTGYSSKIGSGTIPSSTTNGPTIYPGYWSKVRQQWIYTRAELLAAGVTPGQVRGLVVNIINNGTPGVPPTLDGYTMKIGHTSTASFATTSFLSTATATTVFGPANLQKPTFTGLAEIEFTTPFIWNGVDNIVIETCHNYSGVGPAGGNTIVETTTLVNSTLYAFSDNDDQCGTLTGTRINERPNVYFQIPTAVNPNITYSWTGTGASALSSTSIANPVFTGPAAGGTYTLIGVATLNGCAVNSDTLSITVNPNPVAPTADIAISNQCAPGVPAVSVSGNEAEMRWYNQASGGTLLQTGGLTYTTSISTTTTFYVERVVNGCTSGTRTPLTANVFSAPSTPNITVLGNTTFCAGGEVSLQGPAGFSYLWSNGATTRSITVNTAGTYTLQVIANTCTSAASAPVQVTVTPLPSTPTITANGPLAICAEGSVILQGPAGLVYLWSNGATTRSITVTQAGNYSLRTIANGCTSLVSNVLTVTLKPAPPIPTISGGSFFCAGSNTVLTSSSISGNQWLLNGNPLSGATANSYTVSFPGTYSVRVTNGDGCTSVSAPVSVEQLAAPAVPTISGNNTICLGQTTTLTSSALSNNQWLRNGVELQDETGRTLTVSTAGEYTVRVTNANTCSATSTIFRVVVNPTPTVTALANTSTICAGGSTLITASGATNYTWSPSEGLSATSGATVTANPTQTTTYTITGTTNGCSNTTTVTITVNPLPVFTVSTTPTDCGLATGTATVSPSAGVNIFWSNGQTGATANGLAAGNYTVNVVNTTTNCSRVEQFSVVSANAPVVSLSGFNPTATYCADAGVVNLTTSPAGGTLAGPGVVGNTFNPSLAGPGVHTISYSLTQNNCTGIASVEVTVNALPATPSIALIGNTTFCQGDSVTLTAPQSSAYSWSNGATTRSITVRNSGSFTVRVTNASGCQSAVSAAVTVNRVTPPSQPTVSASGATTFCQGDSVILTASEVVGGSYQWSNGATTRSITVRNSGVFSVTTFNGTCASPVSAETSVTVNAAPAKPIISAAGATTFCDGDSVILSSSSATNNLWSTGETTQSIIVRSSAVITLRLTSANGCNSQPSDPVSVTRVNTGSAPSISVSGATTFCQGDSVRLTSSAEVGNLWSNGATTRSIVVRAAGNYSVQVTIGGCQSAASQAVAVSVNPIPAAPTILVNRPTTFCQGDSVVLTAPVATQYLWSTGATTQSITVRSSGTYTLQVGALGCLSPASAGLSVTVNPIPAQPSVTASGATTFCQGDSVILTASEVIGGTYQWSNGSTTRSISVRNTGNFSVQVSLAGCNSPASVAVSVTVNALPDTNFSIAGRILTASQSGLIYQWLFNGQPITGATNQSYEATENGEYSLQVRNAAGCTATSSRRVVVVDKLPLNAMPVIELYPNPATRGIYVKGIVAQTPIRIVTVEGKVLQTLPLPEDGYVGLDLLPQGMYFVEVQGVRKTFVKQ